MKHSVRNKFHGSVFLQLLIVILLTGLAVIFSVGIFFKFIIHPRTENPFKKNLVSYINFIIEDLGSPPDFHKAQAVSENYFFDIRYEGAENRWTTSPDLISLAQADKIIQRHRKKHPPAYMVVSREHGKFLFHPNFKTVVGIREEYVIGLILLLALIFFSAWLWIKWILKPLVLLNHGVQALSRGDLYYEIRIRRKDELGKLAQSFNQMTKRLREMIKAKDQILMDISHEIRSPLTRMKVALELLPAHQNKEALEDDVKEMELLINKILEAGKWDNLNWNPDKTPTNLIPLIKNVIKNYQARPPGVVFTEASHDLNLPIDSPQIKTVLENIIENAIKYSRPDSRPIQLTLGEYKTRAHITIQDDGIGIPEKDLPFISEPFYRVDPSRSKATGGFGLGLSICKRIIEAHGGSLTIESEPGTGTKVVIKLGV
ncbi:HAMP domain-containing histidine kinase [bacterium]|nr:HAMP domain-containing histidine kinase [bacterium]